MLSDKDASRFWTKVDRREPHECWLWTAGVDHRGYGRFYHAGRTRPATHMALLIKGEARQDGKDACHSCDNPRCCNPAHLWWGSRSENMKDAAAKGRHVASRKTHCANGHPFAGSNLIRGRQRRCKTCHYEQTKRSKLNKRILAEGIEHG